MNTTTNTESHSNTGLDTYLSRISLYPLLTKKEEVALSKRIQKQDEEAMEIMVTSNLRLVILIAKEYQHMGLALDDLIALGNIGLMRASKTFDCTKGANMANYSGYWIRLHIRRGLSNTSRTIRLPVGLIEKFRQFTEAALDLSQQNGIEPSNIEIAQRLNLKLNEVDRVKSLSATMVSLDSPIEGDEGETLGEIIADKNQLTASDEIEKQDLYGNLRKAIAELPDRTAQIIRLYYGIDGEQVNSTEMAPLFHISQQRIRMVLSRALKDLRLILAEKADLTNLHSSATIAS